MAAHGKIALRYCGGCNPRYDRIGLVEELKSRFPHLKMEPFHSGDLCLASVVVCGCSSQCAGQDGLPLPRFVLSAPEDLDRAAAFIQAQDASYG